MSERVSNFPTIARFCIYRTDPEACCTVASIIERKRKDGTPSFLAQIVIKRDGKRVHRENKTFPRRREAAAWGAFREGELSKPGVVEEIKKEDPTQAEAIGRYEREAKRLG